MSPGPISSKSFLACPRFASWSLSGRKTGGVRHSPARPSPSKRSRSTLEEPEAREIYRMLERPGESARFLSFEDAWRRFVGSAGDEGPLMELVYLVTRTETLRERLKQQVDAIRDAALESQASKAALDLLAAVSFASALGARIDVASLRESSPGQDVGRIVERLEKEYLVRRLDQGLQLDGLHPVRSHVLADDLVRRDHLRSSHPREALPRPDRGGGYRGVSAAPRVPARRPDACDGPTSQRMAAANLDRRRRSPAWPAVVGSAAVRGPAVRTRRRHHERQG